MAVGQDPEASVFSAERFPVKIRRFTWVPGRGTLRRTAGIPEKMRVPMALYPKTGFIENLFF